MKRRSGFSLIEMLIALTIFTLLSASVYTLLHMGVRHRGLSGESREAARQVRMMYQFIAKDAANMINGAPESVFEGGPDKVSFITLLDSWGTRSGRSRRVPARVVYAYDAAQAVLVRRITILSGDSADGKDAEVFKAPARRAEFTFPYRAASGYQWKPKWSDGTRLPAGIRIRIDEYETVVTVPMGEEGVEGE